MNLDCRSFIFIAAMQFLAISASANCVKCTMGPGGPTAWANTSNIGTAGVGGSTLTPAQTACNLALPGSTPAGGAGSSYAPTTGGVCGTPCSNRLSNCTVVNSTQCDHDVFADDIETCGVVSGSLFECNWKFAQDCCGASPPGDSCTQTGVAPNTTASCGVGGCGPLDRTFGSVVPPAIDDYIETALIAALLIMSALVGRKMLTKPTDTNIDNQQ